MNVKFSLPYLLTGMTMLVAPTHANSHDDGGDNSKYTSAIPAHTIHDTAKNDADSVRTYYAMPTNTSQQFMRVISVNENRYDVIYVCDNGLTIRRSGGSRAWRNNNPGCIRYSDFARQMGALGSAGGFAVFPDEQTGMNAIGALLRGSKYRNLTIADAITKYAPPHENNTNGYKQRLQKMTGLSINIRICDLTDEQIQKVVRAISIIEGWKAGTETHISDPRKNLNALEKIPQHFSPQLLYTSNEITKKLKENVQRTM